MSNMIKELKLVCHICTDKQQIQTLICYFSDNLDNLKVNLSYNYSIKTFIDAASQVKLEGETLGATKSLEYAFVAESSFRKLQAVSIERTRLKVAN